jgi:SAM-dependent methyltransferase
LSYGLVNGDVEQLPFPNHVFDYAFVHDGLHHLTNRDAGVAEMVRVSRCGVMITEPADALLTKLAIALRLIPAREESGNLVLRFDAASLGHRLDDLGFPEFASTRYLMKYGHPPARWWRLFDHPLLFSVARLGFLIIGVRMLGKFGNKLAVAAVRHSSSLVPSTSLLSTPEGSTVHARPKGGKRVPMSWDGRPGLVAVEH